MAIKQSINHQLVIIDWFIDDTFWLYSLENANNQGKRERERKKFDN